MIRSALLRSLGFSQWDTGGGFTALGVERADGAQLMITGNDADCGDMIPSDDEGALLGVYAPDGEQTAWDEFKPAEEDTHRLCQFVIEWRKAVQS